MQIIGVIHSAENPTFQGLLKYLSRINWNGKTVAIEYSGTLERLIELENVDERAKKALMPDTLFWTEVVKLIRKNGGKVVCISHPNLERLHRRYLLHQEKYMGSFWEKTENVSFRRTMRLIHDTHSKRADILITGVDHAYHVKKILGRKADVKLFLPPDAWDNYKEVGAFIKEKKEKRANRKRQWEGVFWPALRTGHKLKRPRFREQLRHRKKTP